MHSSRLNIYVSNPIYTEEIDLVEAEAKRKQRVL